MLLFTAHYCLSLARVSRQLSTDASCLPFIAPAALQLHSHSTTMLTKLRLAGTINCGAILRHVILDATLETKNLRWILKFQGG